MPSGQTSREKSRGLAVSLPGLLAAMTGLSLLYCYWVLGWSARLASPMLRLLLVGGAALLTFWGLNEIAVGIISSYRGRRYRPGNASAPATPRRATQRVASLLGLGMIGFGAAMGLIVAVRAESSVTVVIGFTVGVLLIVAGIRNVVAGLQPERKTPLVRSRQNLTLPGVFYLGMMSAFLVGSLIGRSNMLLLVFTFMAGPFILNGWTTFRMLKQTRISRRLPTQAMAGDTLDVQVTIDNGKSLMSSWVMDVTDRISGNGEELQTGVMFARVPPQSRQTESYRLRLMQRGRYTFGPLSVASRFPLGFVERGLEFESYGELIVYPAVKRLADAWKRKSFAATELVEQERTHAGIYDDEFHRLREHRWGDNPRAIHWRTSARRNELMVREYHQNRDHDLIVALDLWLPPKPAEADLDRVELAASFAASICVDHMQQARESMITIVAVGKALNRWQGQAGPAAFESLLEMLALAEAGSSLPLRDVLQEADIERSPGTRMILLTTHEKRRRALDRTPENRQPQQRLIRFGGWETYITDPATVSRYCDISPTRTVEELNP